MACLNYLGAGRCGIIEGTYPANDCNLAIFSDGSRAFLMAVAFFGMSAAVMAPSRADASQASVEAIRSAWPAPHASIAIQIARRESSLEPSVRGCGGTCYGLFQIAYPAHRHWLAGIGIRRADQLLDPVVNARAAYHLFKLTGSSWRPWCHGSGFPRAC